METPTNQPDLTVAQTIRDQVGRDAMMMIGASDLLGSPDALSFRIGQNAKRVTHIRIVLDPDDTYTMEFLRCSRSARRPTRTVLATVSGVYGDQLCKIIETHTGLYTKF